MTIGKTIALTRQNFVGRLMSLLFNMLSILVIAFLPRRKHLLISWLQSPLEPVYCSMSSSNLLLGRKVMTNLDSVLKSRDITLPTKVHLVKATVFPVVMYGWESWTIKKAERQRIDTL